MNTYNKFIINGWNQFNKININFNKRFTIITGANGAGKTSIVNMLALFANYQSHFHAIPNTTGSQFKVNFNHTEVVTTGPARPIKVASVILNNGQELHYLAPQLHNGAAYQPMWSQGSAQVPTIFIPSVRPTFQYVKVPSISTEKKPVKDISINQISNAQQNIAQVIKTTLLNWAYVGFGSMVVQGDPIYSSYYNGFQELLSSVLPTDLEFEKFEIRNAEIVFICKNKEFLLESVSSGIGTIISIAW